jgi:hypothetical protein
MILWQLGWGVVLEYVCDSGAVSIVHVAIILRVYMNQPPKYKDDIQFQTLIFLRLTPQPEQLFVNVKGAKESIPPAYVSWRAIRQKVLSYRSARLGIDSWAP